MNKLSVNIAGIEMKTPVMTASGTFGFGLELAKYVDLSKLGALVVKGTTLEPRAGNKGRRIAETPAGMLNCIGLENPGVRVFIDETAPLLKQYDVPVIVNISGNTAEEYVELAKLLNIQEVAGLEINISCPNVKAGGMAFGTSPKAAAEIVEKAKKATSKPIITKLSPNVTDIVEIAKAVESAGTDAISLINTPLGMKIDIKKKKPALGNVFGGLSGPAIRPIAVRMVYQVAGAVKVPIIGMGGITTAEDALEFIMAGASAVSVGAGTFIDPLTAIKVAEGIDAYLEKEKIDNIKQLKGIAYVSAQKGG
ncbi:MAG: dihydroorotate dehydrogenase [Holosporaceae bacterium]|jgi:dihydroorotate dehydrogenase (NAD+) catalytic subunit|nr:dihydroorotate dehydrogenase [Holosporaceae bacterium]